MSSSAIWKVFMKTIDWKTYLEEDFRSSLSRHDLNNLLDESSEWVICSLCFPQEGCVVKYPADKSTGALRNHLKSERHKPFYNFCFCRSLDVPKQADIRTLANPAKRVCREGESQQDESHITRKLTFSIGLWVAGNLLPFTTVEKPLFRRIIELAFPRYQIPSRREIADVIRTDVHRAVTEKVSEQVPKFRF